ncbi:hypothetical protein OG369_43375 [Streptomyces sp. NBC_01221]|uniref:hypothetical protein n=1 Tax=Streptomyces sp. NBC_01221 TaxID=2903782 RepID=UPI002255C8AB|nr:hypothetical protein [Streptomyces sp. NBC_01221]MCX4792620.1 hypothetical protein [Streptomyces sp. NBC_01221]
MDQLANLMGGELPDAIKKAREIHEWGKKPQVVRVRRSFVRLEKFGGMVEDERKPLPRSERPLSAQMITPKGLTLRQHLLMLFAAQCEVPVAKDWREPYPIEPTAQEPDSWLGLMATIAKYDGPGVQAASVRTNKVRQITQAMKTLEKMRLLQSSTGVRGQVRRGVLLLCENGKSTDAASIPYTVPADDEAFLEIPIGFFTHGWVHVLTTSEIAALLMWFDVMKFNSQLARGENGTSTTYGFVLSDVRHGRYGLGRDAYETHKPLEAFKILDVHRPDKRHDDGKWADYNEGSRLICHRVELLDGAFDRNADEVVMPVLKRRDATNEWGRPLK